MALNHSSDVDAYDFIVPDNLRPHIERLVPILDANYGGHTRDHLDSYLTNFYRQFKLSLIHI